MCGLIGREVEKIFTVGTVVRRQPRVGVTDVPEGTLSSYKYINVCISKPGFQMKNEKSGFLGVMGPVPCEEPRTTFNLWVGGVFVVSLHPGKAVWEGCWEIHFLSFIQISR